MTSHDTTENDDCRTTPFTHISERPRTAFQKMVTVNVRAAPLRDAARTGGLPAVLRASPRRCAARTRAWTGIPAGAGTPAFWDGAAHFVRVTIPQAAGQAARSAWEETVRNEAIGTQGHATRDGALA